MKSVCLSLSLLLAVPVFSQYTVKQLYEEFKNNSVHFQDKYFNKTLTITGKIRSIHPNNFFIKGMDNSHTVNLTATDYENFVICKVPYENKDKLSLLTPASVVTVTGTFSRKMSDAIVLTDAVFSQPAQTTATPKARQLPPSLPLGYYKCYVDHTTNLTMGGYFTVLANNKYVFHGFDPQKHSGTQGSFTYDATSGKVTWVSGAWKNNNYYGQYSLDDVYGDRLYLIPNGSDYSACKCFLQK